jgi:ligand-binding sensor domain-containing protein
VEVDDIHHKGGLGDDHVWTIHEAREGVLWFGTRLGVSRFDGPDSQNFGIEDDLAGGDVRPIHERIDGTFWFGGRGGIRRRVICSSCAMES